MKNSIQKPTFRLAFCSAAAALEVVLMMVTSLVRIGTYALPCFAGLLTIAVVIEYKCKWAFGVFGVTAVLSFFLSGDKEAVVMFIALFGYYPILKNIIERSASAVSVSPPYVTVYTSSVCSSPSYTQLFVADSIVIAFSFFTICQSMFSSGSMFSV